MYIQRRDQEGVDPDDDQVDAIEFLANYCKDKGLLAEATEYCTRLQDFPGKQEEAKALQRSINSLAHTQPMYDSDDASMN